MKQSKLFGKTFKAAPKDAQSLNQILLARGGFVKQLMAGVYSLLPLGFRVLKNIENAIREELTVIGAQEVVLPVIHPAGIWKKTGRWNEIGEELWRIKNREGQDFALAMTHEEAIAEMAGSYVTSYLDLPLLLNQFQVKIRDEQRPRGGLLRLKEFMMQDAYSFDHDEAALDKTYKRVFQAYRNIFKKLELKVEAVKADSGIMGGSESHEFKILSDAGEDELDGKKAIELGHTFKLGLKYSKPFNIRYKNKTGEEKFVVMGSYGIGLERLMAAVVETKHDEKGIIWPAQISPFKIHFVAIRGDNSNVKKTADKLYEKMNERFEILFDDRDDKTPGEKFADADLIGIPLRIVVSSKTLEKNSVELKYRDSNQIKLVKIKDLHKTLHNQ